MKTSFDNSIAIKFKVDVEVSTEPCCGILYRGHKTKGTQLTKNYQGA